MSRPWGPGLAIDAGQFGCCARRSLDGAGDGPPIPAWILLGFFRDSSSGFLGSWALEIPWLKADVNRDRALYRFKYFVNSTDKINNFNGAGMFQIIRFDLRLAFQVIIEISRNGLIDLSPSICWNNSRNGCYYFGLNLSFSIFLLFVVTSASAGRFPLAM